MDVESSASSNPAKGKKRQQTEASRATMSYPRKRAVTACQLCRVRKTKCNNARPKCKICEDAGANCVYDDRSDHSAFDPASLLILERLDTITQRLDKLANNSRPDQHAETLTTTHLSHGSLPSRLRVAEAIDEEVMRIPSSRSSPDAILQWPIFEGYFEPDCLVNTLFEAESTSGGLEHLSSSRGTHQDDEIVWLVDNFLVNTHIKNPILDADTLTEYVQIVVENGAQWDDITCLVFITCALGALAKPFDSTICGSLQTSGLDSLKVWEDDLALGAKYFAMARKRLGLLRNSLIRSQCFFLSGVYFMYIVQPIEAYHNFLQASTTYHVYLKGRLGLAESGAPELVRTRRLEQRLFWSCFKSECELRVELSLPESGIAGIRYPDMFPSPPTGVSPEEGNIAVFTPTGSETTPSVHGFQRSRTMSSQNSQQQSWYYYLTEIALRRIGNRILNVLFIGDYPGAGMTVPEMIVAAQDFENQFSRWYSGLPEAISFSMEDHAMPSDELTFMVRARAIDYLHWLMQPFLYYAIHHSPTDQFRPLCQPFVDKCLKYCISVVKIMSVFHRHHGTWFGQRNGTAAAFNILAAAKCGHIAMPIGWEDAVRLQLVSYGYWGRESPDIAKSKTIVESLFKSMSKDEADNQG